MPKGHYLIKISYNFTLNSKELKLHNIYITTKHRKHVVCIKTNKQPLFYILVSFWQPDLTLNRNKIILKMYLFKEYFYFFLIFFKISEKYT